MRHAQVSIDVSWLWELAFCPYVHVEAWTVLRSQNITHTVCLETTYISYILTPQTCMFGWRDIIYNIEEVGYLML